jgi:chromosome segregation ATPase
MDIELTMQFITDTLAGVVVRQQESEFLTKEVKARFDLADARAAKADARFAKADARFAKADARADRADARADRADARLDKMERQMKGIQTLAKTAMKIMISHGHSMKNLDFKIAALTDAQIRAQDEMRDLRQTVKRNELRFEKWLESMNRGSNGHKKKPN